jgi:hypothetical protein
LRPGGFPWLVVAGKLLTGWVVIDLDATLIAAHSVEAGAAATFKRGYGSRGRRGHRRPCLSWNHCPCVHWLNSVGTAVSCVFGSGRVVRRCVS